MGRIRTVKPEFWLNEDMASISESACLLALGLLNYSDDDGYFNANIALIKAAVFPIREPSGSITVLLRELSSVGYIELFSCENSRSYGKVTNFKDHQVINKPTASKIKDLTLLPYDYGSDTVGLPSGKEGKGKERKGRDKPPTPLKGGPTVDCLRGKLLKGQQAKDFLRFWESFSYKEGRAGAATSWSKIKDYSPELVERIIAAATDKAKRRSGEDKTPQMAQGWLSGKRWEDEPLEVKNIFDEALDGE